MEREDPLQRLEREERERAERGSGASKLVWALAAVAAVLAIALAVVWIRNRSVINENNKMLQAAEVQKQELTEEILALKSEYADLSSEYEAINMQLDSSRLEIDELVTRIKQTEAADLAKIRKYEKELGTLRSIMRNYVVQIDSLNQLNHKLTADLTSARQEIQATATRNQELNEQVKDLTNKVAVGSALKGRGIALNAFKKNGKDTDRSSRVDHLRVDLVLSENALAQQGPVTVYVRVKDPEGNLLLDGTGASFSFGGESLAATASREIDYTGSDVEMSIYVNNIPEFFEGFYSAEVFAAGSRLGKAELRLR